MIRLGIVLTLQVPRAEFTFIVDDATQVTRICSEEEWPGATAVKARGQVASPLFEHSASYFALKRTKIH